MDKDRMEREIAERIERGSAEVKARIDRVERLWREEEEKRRREWEALEGRLLTAEEERRLFNDGLLRKMTAMTDEYIKVLREFGHELQIFGQGLRDELAEQRAQLRANTEATWKMLDRLPPPEAA